MTMLLLQAACKIDALYAIKAHQLTCAQFLPVLWPCGPTVKIFLRALQWCFLYSSLCLLFLVYNHPVIQRSKLSIKYLINAVTCDVVNAAKFANIWQYHYGNENLEYQITTAVYHVNVYNTPHFTNMFYLFHAKNITFIL